MSISTKVTIRVRFCIIWYFRPSTRKIFTALVEESLKDICIGISERYEFRFVEIGVDEDHVHFLVQSVPIISVTELVKLLKSLTARQLFLLHPEIKKQLWGGPLWTSGYYVNTVGLYANKDVIQRYVAGQGQYKKLYVSQPDLDFGAF